MLLRCLITHNIGNTYLQKLLISLFLWKCVYFSMRIKRYYHDWKKWCNLSNLDLNIQYLINIVIAIYNSDINSNFCFSYNHHFCKGNCTEKRWLPGGFPHFYKKLISFFEDNMNNTRSLFKRNFEIKLTWVSGKLTS